MYSRDLTPKMTFGELFKVFLLFALFTGVAGAAMYYKGRASADLIPQSECIGAISK